MVCETFTMIMMTISTVLVLILVLMEDGLRAMKQIVVKDIKLSVLILVLMEDGLRELWNLELVD